jgi:hypothetical protein
MMRRMIELTTTQQLPRVTTDAGAGRRRKRFALHVGEMMAAMGLGMLVLGGAIAGGLALVGTSLSAAPPALHAAVMAGTMTLPMAGWMRYRGHPLRDNVEMAASMIVPTVLVIGLYWAGAVASGAVVAVQHAVMIPAMVGLMLWRYDHYSH